MLGPGNKYEVNRQFRILHKQELQDRMMNFWMLQWDGNVARIESQGMDIDCFSEPLEYLIRDREDRRVILLSTCNCKAHWPV